MHCHAEPEWSPYIVAHCRGPPIDGSTLFDDGWMRISNFRSTRNGLISTDDDDRESVVARVIKCSDQCNCILLRDLLDIIFSDRGLIGEE